MTDASSTAAVLGGDDADDAHLYMFVLAEYPGLTR